MDNWQRLKWIVEELQKGVDKKTTLGQGMDKAYATVVKEMEDLEHREQTQWSKTLN